MLMWCGQTLSELGTQVSLVAYPLLVLALTGSPAKAGVVGFARTLPIALLAVPAGALADRVNRKHLMVACDGVRAIAVASIPVALATGGAPYGLIVVVAFVDGSGFVTSYITERGALRRLVEGEQLPEAVARNESRSFGAMLVGPPLGGLLFGIGRAVPFVADAVSYAASTVAMLLIRTDFQEAPAQPERRGLGDGFRWIWRRPFYRACALLFAAGNPIYTGLYLLIVIVAKRHGASPAAVGAMLAIAAAGGLLGTLMAPALQRRWRPRAALLAETSLTALAIPMLLVAHSPVLLGLIVGLAEVFTPVTNSMVAGSRVALAPDALQGRVQAAATVISFAAGWAGPLAVGILVQDSGVTTTVLVLAGWALAMAVAVLAIPAFRSDTTHRHAVASA
jgi:MFS family permease